MAITAITPAAGSPIEAGDSASFTIDDTYTSLVIKVQTSTALAVAYSTALGGGQSGYTVTVMDNGDGTHTVTYSSNAGWDIHPQLIYVVEDETGTEATTNLSYDIVGESPYPQGSYPYNSTSGPVVVSFNARGGVVVPEAGDYDTWYYTETEADVLYALALPLAGGTMVGNIIMSSTETVDGRDLSVDGAKLDLIEALADVTDVTNVTAAGALMDSEVDADIKTLVLPASTTISAFGATLVDDADAATARTTIDSGRAPLSGAGAPGVSTGNTYALGQIYVDTTGDLSYTLVDATTDANVWSAGGGGGGGGGGNFTLACNELVDIDAAEVVIGGAYIDGSTGGTYSWTMLATYNDLGGAGNQDLYIYLYDMGPDGTPAAGILRSTLLLDTSVAGLDSMDYVSLALTAGGSPGVDTDTIFNTARMYECRAKIDATGAADTAKILNVNFVEA